MTGSLLGVGAAALVTNLFDEQTVADWAWRLPFLAGAILGSTAFWIRRNLHESERFRQHHQGREETSPLLEAFTTNRRETLLALMFAASYGTSYYIAFVYLPEWLSAEGLMSRGSALAINTVMTLIVIPAMPLAAIVGDRWLPRRVWIGLAILLLALVAWPMHYWMLTSGGSLASILLTHGVCFLLLSVPLGSGPALFVELFPERDRLSGYSVAFNIGLGVFGGLTPMIAATLIAVTGAPTAPAIYLAVTALIAVLALALMPDRSREPLR
jgi:MHS family proline/betaine transporter-like MFS transporter